MDKIKFSTLVSEKPDMAKAMNIAIGAPVNVKHYGAVGDGVTDDTAAIQEAIDSVAKRASHVIIPPGHYKLTSPIVVGNSTKIIGAGSLMTSQSTMTYYPQVILDFSSIATDGIVTPDEDIDYRAHGIVLKSLTIKGSGDGNGKSGILFRTNTLGTSEIKKVGLSKVIDCYIEDFGIGINFNDEADSCWLMDSHIHNCGIGLIGGSSESKIYRNIFWNISGSHVIQSAEERSFISGNEFEPNGTTVIILEGTNNVISDNLFRLADTGIYLKGSRNSIHGNRFSYMNNYGILADSADFNSISSNIFGRFGETSAGGKKFIS